MPVLSPAEFKHALAPGQRILGLDVGTKTIGLALSDVGRSIASPHSTIRRGRFARDAKIILDLVDTERVGGFVVGLPLNLDGTEGPRCQSVRQFAANLLKLRDLPLAFWDERLSTAAVTRTLLEADASRRRRAQLVDKLAAAYIAQGFLDAPL